ncbi:sodium:proton antiporter [Sporosarcina sp. P37]|uniref:Na+/H+ antiporter NhaC family protein n=1 Tax=unclassified Sporosarcina TaxID=2647733 RepID=UPI0009C0BDC5|nr:MULTISPECIES: Na+/H+ antiporter NhaC family protein [unclassified Sporosarcina]ARK25018.1 sodium:proton antiporter [Sporosarcina sp. P37]PID18164.1 sodium:proton antiporter [Sporosarcina sp. P35]
MNDKRLKMYGGVYGGLIPIGILLVGLIWLSVAGMGGTTPFWAAGWAALALGILFAKDKYHYCEAIIRGISDRNGMIIVCAALFAGVFGVLMVAGGLVEGLLWFGFSTGAQGVAFTLIAFIAAMIFSMGTGDSTGTILALAPVLYPAGFFLGADPTMLALAILSGAVFGDNLAPISDTTIVSASTQGATMRDVVRTRFPLSITAALITFIVLAVFGGGGKVQALPEMDAAMNPSGLFMLAALAVVLISSLSGRHIIESLIWGNLSAMAIGLLTQNISIKHIFHIPSSREMSTGIIQDGITGVTGVIVFVLLVLAITQILIESGIMDRLLNWTLRVVAKTVRSAELSIIFTTILVSIPISANTPAELLVGPTFVKKVGEKFKLSPARRANLMDCAVCTIFYTMPWHIAVVVWYSTISSAAGEWGIIAPSIASAFINPYSWALLAVLLFSAITGWNRKYATDAELALIEGEEIDEIDKAVREQKESVTGLQSI